MLSNELEKLTGNEVQEYLFEQTGNDIPRLQLRHFEMFGLPFRLIAEQLAARKKIAAKLPSFYSTKGILYPPSINLEQCSSEATANFKLKSISREIGKNKFKVADLTGGFGIDSFFLSKEAALLDYIEPDAALSNLVQHNHSLLGGTNVLYHQKTAEEFLDQNTAQYDLIYLDPSRRNVKAKKVFRLADCQPDILKLLPKILEFTESVLIKTSPLLDIYQGLKELAYAKKVIVVSLGNECKELLFLLKKKVSEEPIIETYNLDGSGEIIHSFSFIFSEEKNCVSAFGEPQTYLYEPNAAILKAGAFKIVGKRFSLQKLHPSTHLYTSSALQEFFPGRVFKIELLDFDSKNFPQRKANVITRNYPMKPEELKKKLKLIDGGEKYVMGFAGLKKKYIVLAKRLA